MVVTSVKSKQGFVWVPPEHGAAYKITVTRSDSTVDDLTDSITNLEVDDNVTSSIGTFSLEIYNPNETYTGVWHPGDTFLYYKDYDLGTTLAFRGRVERVDYRLNKIKISGRSESLRLMEITVTKSYTDTQCDLILKDLIDNYASSWLTYSGVEVSSTTYTVTWVNKPFWEAVQELCQTAGYDAFVDCDNDMQFFEVGTRLNPQEAVVHDYNLLEQDGFSSEDSTQVINRIRVYGAVKDGIQIIYTAEDTDSQSTNFTREEVFTDSSITSYSQAKAYGDYLLAQKKDAPISGEVTSILLGLCRPGDKIYISNPMEGIPPAQYTVKGYVDKLGIENGDLTTTIRINKEPRKLQHVFKDIINKQSNSTEKGNNMFDMEHSLFYPFDTDEGTHSNTVITDGVLKVSTGSIGTWYSPSYNHSTAVSQAVLVLVGTNLEYVTVSLSIDNGLTYNTLTKDTIVNIATTGVELLVKVYITSENTEIQSLSVQYK